MPAASTKRPPARKTSAKKSARKDGASRPRTRRVTSRYAVVYDINGPRVRLGIGWFVLALIALGLGTVAAAVIYGAAAAAAAAQTARAWRRRRARPSEPVAAAGAGVLTAGALLGAGGVGVACFVLVGLALWWAFMDRRSPNDLLTDAGLTIQCALPVGLAAACMVLALRLELGAAVALLVLVSAYEIGDFIIGSGARNPYEGPIAGMSAVLVASFALGWFGMPARDLGSAFTFGVVAAVLCPLGQLVASAILPAAGAPASALRRLDSMLLLSPVWAWAIGIYLESAR